MSGVLSPYAVTASSAGTATVTNALADATGTVNVSAAAAPGAAGSILVSSAASGPAVWSSTLGTALFATNAGTATVASSQLALATTLGLTGYAKVNTTGTLLTWTSPNDGNIHRVQLFLYERVTSNETGGQLNIQWTDPSNTAQVGTVLSANQTTGPHNSTSAGLLTQPVYPNTQYSVVQQTALSVGTCTVWAEIWAL